MFLTKDMKLWGTLFFPLILFTPETKAAISEVGICSLFTIGYIFLLIKSKKQYSLCLEKRFPRLMPYLYSVGWISYAIYIFIFIGMFFLWGLFDYPDNLILQILGYPIIYTSLYGAYFAFPASLLYQRLKKKTDENTQPVKHFYKKHIAVLLCFMGVLAGLGWSLYVIHFYPNMYDCSETQECEAHPSEMPQL